MGKKRTRVLYVDDNADARALLGHLLEVEEDLEHVGSRENAEDLEEVIRATSPDVLLIDLMMPGRDPIEAIRETREAFPRLRIVVLSAAWDPKLLERATAAGASQLAMKSLDVSETLDAIRGR